MHLVQLDRDGIAGPDRGNFGTAFLSRNHDGALATHNVIEFGHLPVQVRTRRSTWRKHHVVYISPRASKDSRLQHASILYCPIAPAHTLHGTKQCTVQPHGHENRYRIEGHVPAVISEVEIIVRALH